MKNNNSKIVVVILFFIVAALLVFLMVYLIKKANEPEPVPEINQTELEENRTREAYNKLLFDYKIVRKTNNLYNNNYLVSPLSLGYAMKILEEGASGVTKQQLTDLLNNYPLPKVVNIDKKISIANALFINTAYKGKINNNFVNQIEAKYAANTMYDSFSSTEGINNWVNGKTFGMIPRALGSIDRNTAMAIVNTVALDIEWKQKMSAQDTHSGKFTKIDKTPIDVAMMKDTNNFGYLENENARGIIKHYAVYDTQTGEKATAESQNKLELEYIAIMPKTNINDYINNLDQYELSKLISTVKVHSAQTDLVMNIPKYTYEFNLDALKAILYESYVTNMFDPSADFSTIYEGLYISDVIHKTFIDFGEEGTRAAAASIITATDGVEAMDKEVLKIDFNVPFIYLIKEKNSTNLWFFGVVYEPMLWSEYQKLIEQAQREAERKKRGY